ncbi:MAG TPA: EamA family transporter, partial [Spirillospora sp.]|nr:EamA family transporter [Spirillospora sp.]
MNLTETAGILKAQTQTKAWPYLVIFAGFFIGAGGPILIRLAQSEGIPSLVIVAYRQIISVLFLTPIILSSHRHELRQLAPRDLIWAALAGIVLAVRFFLMFEAFNNTSVLITGVLNGSGPLWVALTEVIFLKAVFNRNIWLGLFLALVGGVLMAFAGFD